MNIPHKQIIPATRTNRRILFSVGVFGIFLYYLVLLNCNHYLAAEMYSGILWRISVPAMFGIYLAVRGFRDGTEIRILIFFWLWILVVYFLNGDHTLSEYADYYIDMSAIVLMFAPGILLCGKKRETYFEISCILIAFISFILSLICIYCAIHQTSILNPIDQYSIRYGSYPEGWRITVFNAHPNITAGQFLISLSASLWLILYRKNPVLRFVLSVNAVLSFITIALTLSRNGQTISGIILGLFVGILVLEKIKSRGLSIRIISLILSVIIIAIATYNLNEPIRFIIWKSSTSLNSTVAVETSSSFTSVSAKPLAFNSSLSSESEYRSDERGYFESGRKEIFWSAIKSLELEPKRLLIGSSGSDVMRISNHLIREQASHFHNVFLQVVNEYGLLGLALVTWFFFLLSHHGLRMLLSSDGRFRPDDKMLTVPVLGFILYYQLECGIFTYLDYRAVFFFLVSGVMTGCYKEHLVHAN